ncbi:MAG: hypothetical protein C0602_04150 [Denitrovibrio sp.]|nr:MAG: hypothetical protein C0602_04150 [Denitrovibrio sp.]
MQIDFHHTVTYVLARLAGFNHEDAHIISYSAQYVDDATNGGTIRFENDATYTRIASAHHIYKLTKFNDVENHHVWVPFHFLPGNGEKPDGTNIKGNFIHKLVCKPNSTIAKDMLSYCLADRNKPYALHRLGISMHVFADTWAHREFAGICDEINKIDLYNAELADKLKSSSVGSFFPMGHGPALTFPDMPFLEWSYQNGRNVIVERDNTTEFIDAAEKMYAFMLEYNKQPRKQLPEEIKKIFRELFLSLTDEDGHERHKGWIEAIRSGRFKQIGEQELTYIPKGAGSWKHVALETEKETDDYDERFEFKSSFMTSNWKMFHDALQAHRFDVIHDILPRYGICAG